MTSDMLLEHLMMSLRSIWARTSLATVASDMLLEHLMMYIEVNLSKNITGYSD